MTKYRQLADELRQAIEQGGLAPGMRLPSVRELMKQHQLSLATVTSALRMLEEQDLVEPQDKAGYFVKGRDRVDRRDSRATAMPFSNSRRWGPAEDLFPHKRWQRLMINAIRSNPAIVSRYPFGEGSLRLRAELANCSATNGCFLKEDELIVTQGATEGLFLALRAATNPGDKVLVQFPMGRLFSQLLELLNLEPVYLHQPVDSSEFIAEVERKLQSESPKVLLLVVNFHYPTGALMPLPAKRELLRLAERKDLVIIENDVYGDLHHEGSRPLTLKSFDLSGRVMYVNSCSKSMAPGLRIGWIAAGRWKERICHLKCATSSSVNELAQSVLTEYLAQGSYLPNLRKLRQKLKARKEEYVAAMRPALSPAITLRDVAGGFCYWLPFPAQIDADQFRGLVFARWPVLIENDVPNLEIVDQGICLNTSIQLTRESRQALLELCVYLRSLFQNAN